MTGWKETGATRIAGMAKLRITEYVVVGDGPFPLDMLRYDVSYPADTDSAMAILSEAGFGMRPLKSEPRRVTLRHRDVYAGWMPTDGRWSSFGWHVDHTKTRDWIS